MLTLLLSLMYQPFAQEISASDTTYNGASILTGEYDVSFGSVSDINYNSDPNAYAYFEGNTLYVGNTDDKNNTIDAIVEFFWFQSSINRNSDFYVAVVKVRANPNEHCSGTFTDCELWSDDWADFGYHPVVSFEAFTDTSREQGAFRWDWASPFEDYGIDAYGQVTFQNSYGIGVQAEGSAMSGVALPANTNVNGVPVEGDANVQVKGYVNPSYKVQTQYNVTLYEWDVFVHGTPSLMAWDMYLNIGERAGHAAYQEYFLPIQVHAGESFLLDELNFSTNFDFGYLDTYPHELGVSIKDVEISLPYWEPDPTMGEPSSEPSTEPAVEPTTEPAEDTGIEDTSVLDENEDTMEPAKIDPPARCSTSPATMVWLFLVSFLGISYRRNSK